MQRCIKTKTYCYLQPKDLRWIRRICIETFGAKEIQICNDVLGVIGDFCKPWHVIYDVCVERLNLIFSEELEKYIRNKNTYIENNHFVIAMDHNRLPHDVIQIIYIHNGFLSRILPENYIE